MTKSIRIRDIAAACGVSAGAVSRALKGQPGLREETRQRIIATAEQQGYDFSRLRNEKIKRILFLIHRQHDIARALPFYSSILLGVEDACRQQGIAMSFMSAEPGEHLSEQIALHGPDALICTGYFEPGFIAQLQQLKLPMVLVDLWAGDIASVNPDNVQGGYLATQHLINQGRRRIAFLASTRGHYGISQRENGYRKALYDARLLMPPEYAVIATPLVDTRESIVQALTSLLALPEPPDAIFAYNDVTAIMAISMCIQKGFRVPEDIAVVGFDNIEPAAWHHPPLTTIDVDKTQLGREAIALLLRGEQKQVIQPVTLIVRSSSGPGADAISRP